ncbi:MAG: phosphoglycerate dehydrogenase [Rhodospirillaceae bacterium]|nr:phosphoglycerate dehydrogenase [Rhodospirillaceae bacterium]OUU20215.1 MAG: phosphoglycerate dehydrogenase [Candidatus Endolissoclinum sp. TMED37]
MPKVLVSDKLSEDVVAIFKSQGISVDYKPGMSPEELSREIHHYDGLAVRSASKITKGLILAATNLKVIGRAGIGVDNIDVDAASAAGIVVMNTPFGNAVTTAEHAISMICALARQIPEADRSTQEGLWEKARFVGTELTGKTLGIIGCGNIGSIVADRAQGLKMKVAAFDPYLTEERAESIGVRKLELKPLLADSDFISLHTPLTEQTKNIISAEALIAMKRGVRIINCARGGLISEQDLKAALEDGHVAGAALDVFSEEPATNNILFGVPGVIATPHLGASTMEAQEKVALQVAEQMSDFLNTGSVSNALNMPAVSAEEAPILKPYIKLAGLLGSFSGQVADDAIEKVEIEFEGLATELNHAPIVSAILAGILKHTMDSVNLVSAPLIANSRGIDISTIKHDRACDYQTLLRVSVGSKSRTRVLAGTLFAGTQARLVDIQGIKIEAEFAKSLLYIRNYDSPGFIGALGTLLGNEGINIATFHLGRRENGGEALALVEVEGHVSDAVLSDVRSLPQVVRANYLTFQSD